MLKKTNKFNHFQVINYVFSNLQDIFSVKTLNAIIPYRIWKF